ncbi:adoMet-dependent rRNA methyltransferase spb1-like [Humulus lupulus]|uniref:adoMet-dependent rRNA methyltransferase spb1-like n=1 Tax=Humulus lupulus TaxID=3486 RepID=UPI002B41561C|nr:adoMet-dependent rRNA methyltransferase spb1-like [Humulus lupulus]
MKEDIYRLLAKERGFRSLAAWKLIQLDNKCGLFRSDTACAVLDLCAAPGGWTQVVLERVGHGSLVVGVDLVCVIPIRGATFVEQDITKLVECKSSIKAVMSEHNCSAFDLVLHDGSHAATPSMGAASRNTLVIDALKLATHLLAPNATFVTKAYRCQDYNSVKYCLQQLFERVEVYKPRASRSSSAEVYVVAFNYKAGAAGAAKNDPDTPDVGRLFQEAIHTTPKKEEKSCQKCGA